MAQINGRLLLVDFSKLFCKVKCVLPMVVDSMLPHAEFGPNDHREDAPHFRISSGKLNLLKIWKKLFLTSQHILIQSYLKNISGSMQVWTLLMNEQKYLIFISLATNLMTTIFLKIISRKWVQEQGSTDQIRLDQNWAGTRKNFKSWDWTGPGPRRI